MHKALVAILVMVAACQWPSAQNTRAATVPQPDIVSKRVWGAAPANERLMRKQKVRAIIVHHTGEGQNRKLTLEKKLRGLQAYSMRRDIVSETRKVKPAWGDMPYHYYVDLSGRIGEGRDPRFAGDTNTGYRTDGYLQVVVEGHFDREKPTAEQLYALDSLVLFLAAKYGIRAGDITGHNDHAASDCPGKNLKPYLSVLRKKVSAALGPR